MTPSATHEILENVVNIFLNELYVLCLKPIHQYELFLRKRTDQDQRTAIVNIGGREFRTKFSNFLKYPDSRLGRICHATHLSELQSLCDGFIPGPVPVLFFDRNPQHFGTILDVYRKQEVHVCEMHCSLGTVHAMLNLTILINCCLFQTLVVSIAKV